MRKRAQYLIIRLDHRVTPLALSYWTHGNPGDNTTASRWTLARGSAAIYHRKADAIRTAKGLAASFSGEFKVNTLKHETVWTAIT